MPDTPSQLLATAYTWYSTTLRDLVRELLDETGLDTDSDTVDDLCGELWLHATEFSAARELSFVEVLDLLDRNAGLLVNRLRSQPAVELAGRLQAAADSGDVAELAIAAVDRADHQPLLRHRPVGQAGALRSAA